MSDGHTEVVAYGCPGPDCLVTNMAVSYQCQLRQLTATFSWRRSQGDAPGQQWLQVSLFKNLWDPGAGSAVQEISLEPGVTSVSLLLEPDSVYYWRLQSKTGERFSHSPIQQIETPSCIADFVEEA